VGSYPARVFTTRTKRENVLSDSGGDLQLKEIFEMGIAKRMFVCALCGYVGLKGLHIEHECRMGWCPTPVIEHPDTPHNEHEPIQIVLAQQQVMPPSRGWVRNNPQVEVMRRGYPAWDTNGSGNAAWLEAATKQTKIAGWIER
jgi:hypothetical protein